MSAPYLQGLQLADQGYESLGCFRIQHSVCIHLELCSADGFNAAHIPLHALAWLILWATHCLVTLLCQQAAGHGCKSLGACKYGVTAACPAGFGAREQGLLMSWLAWSLSQDLTARGDTNGASPNLLQDVLDVSQVATPWKLARPNRSTPPGST